MYKLDNRFVGQDFVVTVVGCGGTGTFVAEGLARILPADTRLVLIDYDRVEERNLSRQEFFREDIDQFKSEVTAHRLAKKYRRPVAYAVSPLQLTQICYPGIVIGCVDNGKSRGGIANKLGEHSPYAPQYEPYGNLVQDGNHKGYTKVWWVDAGNGENYGQILIGNARIGQLDQAFDVGSGICGALPFPIIQSPDLLKQVPVVRDCAEIADQEPVINRVMAALTIEVVRRIINGTCSWMQLWLDLEAGTLTPVYATMENVSNISKKSVKRLIRKGGGDDSSV